MTAQILNKLSQYTKFFAEKILVAQVILFLSYSHSIASQSDVQFEVKKIFGNQFRLKTYEGNQQIFNQKITFSSSPVHVESKSCSVHSLDDHLVWRYQGTDKSCLSFTLNKQGDIILSQETTGKDTLFETQKSWGFKTEGKFINEANSIFYKLNVEANQVHNLAVLKSFQGDFASSYYFNKGVMHFGDKNSTINTENYDDYLKHLSSDTASAKPNSIFNENNLINDYGITLAQEGLKVEGLTYRIYGSMDVASLDLKQAKMDVRGKGKLVIRDQLQGQDKEYFWSKPALKSKVVPSQTEDLFQSRLPNEVVSYMMSWLPFRDFAHFGLTSTQLHQIFRSTLTSTNFLTSDAAYAKAFMHSLFGQVRFDPAPKAIKVSRSVNADEIHFRDTDHLRRIIDEIPKVEAKKELFFILDKDVKEGEEFVSLEGNLTRQHFINVMSDVPLMVSGRTELSCFINFPRSSNLNQLSAKTGGNLCTGTPKAYQQGHDLANVLDQFDENLFDRRNKEVSSLLENRKKALLETPHPFPAFKKLCPKSFLSSFSKIHVLQKDYINGDGPIIYKANSISSLRNLYDKFPAFFSQINYIDSQCKKSGIYSSNSLYITPGLKIFSETDLLMTGEFHLPEYFLHLESLNNIWILSCQIRTDHGIRRSGKYIYSGSLNEPLSSNIKPEGMPNGLWFDLLEYYGARIVSTPILTTIFYPN